MITCPQCGTSNHDGSRFCIKCGQALGAATTPPAPALRRLFAGYTTQMLVGLLALFVLRGWLQQTPFVVDLRLPGVPLSTSSLLTIVVDGVAVAVLLRYGQIVNALWPQAYPRQAALAPALTCTVGLGVVSAFLYRARTVGAPLGG